MKKGIAVILLTCMLLLLAGCGRADVTAEKFADAAREFGFAVEDVTAELEGNVEAAVLAYTDTVQMEFYAVASERQAKQAFEENQAELSAAQAQPDVEAKDKWAGEAGGEYRVVSMGQKTFLYVSAPIEEKEQVDSFLKAIGY